ncbi:hypothetical protein ABT275_43710 [Streptomyces sp. NPDC001185]|uniref:hypothetical protein n=1 Tax=Streptomyces sp. NPDC001185 TaxID=3154380 RepID=UPI0033198220
MHRLVMRTAGLIAPIAREGAEKDCSWYSPFQMEMMDTATTFVFTSISPDGADSNRVGPSEPERVRLDEELTIALEALRVKFNRPLPMLISVALLRNDQYPVPIMEHPQSNQDRQRGTSCKKNQNRDKITPIADDTVLSITSSK